MSIESRSTTNANGAVLVTSSTEFAMKEYPQFCQLYRKPKLWNYLSSEPSSHTTNISKAPSKCRIEKTLDTKFSTTEELSPLSSIWANASSSALSGRWMDTLNTFERLAQYNEQTAACALPSEIPVQVQALNLTITIQDRLPALQPSTSQLGTNPVVSCQRPSIRGNLEASQPYECNWYFKRGDHGLARIQGHASTKIEPRATKVDCRTRFQFNLTRFPGPNRVTRHVERNMNGNSNAPTSTTTVTIVKTKSGRNL